MKNQTIQLFFNLLTRKSFFICYCGKEINICFKYMTLRTSTIHHRKLIFSLYCVYPLHVQKQRAFKMIFTELLNKVCEAKEIYAW